MSGMGVGDWITIVAGVIGIFLGLYLIRPSKRSEIVDLWKAKWSLFCGFHRCLNMRYTEPEKTYHFHLILTLLNQGKKHIVAFLTKYSSPEILANGALTGHIIENYRF